MELKQTLKQKINLKDRIFQALDNTGYLTDSQACKLAGYEVNFSTIEEYKRQWHRLQADKGFFGNKKIVKVFKGHRCYVAELENKDTYKVGKDFYEENKNNYK